MAATQAAIAVFNLLTALNNSMSPVSGVFGFIVFSLVTWRLTHLLGREDGPFDLVFLLRKKAGSGFFGHLMDCFYCLSIWIALPFGVWEGNTWWEKLLYWLALSGAACLLEQATTGRKADADADEVPDYTEE